MGMVTVRVDSSGRLVIPKERREELGTPQGGELHGATRVAAIRRVQRRLAALAPREGETSAVDELIADRRAEAAREEAEEQAWEAAHRGGRTRQE
jgi:bifunctional DNA-binding transcriptional regulator/antitoxin component of YhaV-PrlF toxin-antitoxin module